VPSAEEICAASHASNSASRSLSLSTLTLHATLIHRP
jgi:hypothetical protein